MSPGTSSSKRHTSAFLRVRMGARSPRKNTAAAAKMLQLIEAAEDIFLAKGYHTATMNDVAAAAGMSKKTVYQLIESKAELFAALLEYNQEKYAGPETQEDLPVQEMLTQHLLSIGEFLLSSQQIAIIRLIMAEYTHGKDFGRIFHQKRVMKCKSALENCLLQIGPPVYKESADVKEMAAMLFGMTLGEFHLGVLIGFRPMPTKAMLTHRIRVAVDLFLNGCNPQIRSKRMKLIAKTKLERLRDNVSHSR